MRRDLAIRFGSQKSVLTECCFFATPVFTEIFSWNLTRLWQPITMALNLQITKTTTFSEPSGRSLSHGTPPCRSYPFKSLSNLRFSFSSFGVYWRFQHRAPDVALLNHWSWPFEPFHWIFCMISHCLWWINTRICPFHFKWTPFDHF